jgi:hypothetical protein
VIVECRLAGRPACWTWRPGLESPAPVLRRIDEIERERVAVEQRVVAWKFEDEASRSFSDVTEAQVRRCLRGMAD